MSFHLTPINQRMGKIGNQKCLIWPESIVQLSLIYSHLPALFHFQRSAEQEQPQQHNAIITIGIVCVPIETRPVSVTRCMKQDTGSSSTLARAPKNVQLIPFNPIVIGLNVQTFLSFRSNLKRPRPQRQHPRSLSRRKLTCRCLSYRNLRRNFQGLTAAILQITPKQELIAINVSPRRPFQTFHLPVIHSDWWECKPGCWPSPGMR